MAKNVQLKLLQKRERQIVLLMDSVDRFIQNYEPERDECQISSRLQALEPVFDEFHEVRSKIELIFYESEEKKAKELYGDAKDEAEAQREEENDRLLLSFEDRFFQLKGALSKLQNKPERAPNVDDSSHSQGHAFMGSRVKLPEIRLPSFSGKLREWVSFRDSFQSLIHNNGQLAPMEKFSYLRSSLSGEALEEVLSIELSDVNYSVAWEILTERYENKKLIVKAYLDTLFTLEPIKKEGYESINQLITEFEKNLMMLQKVGEDTDGWSTILAHMLHTRLDPVSLRNWETQHNSKEVPKYEDMRKFLRNYCSVLQSVAPAKEPRFNVADHHPPNRLKSIFAIIAARIEHLIQPIVNGVQISGQSVPKAKSNVSVPPGQQGSIPGTTFARNSQAYQQQRQQTMPIVTETHTQALNATHNSPNTTTQINSTMPSTSQSYVALSVKPASNTLLPTALVKIKDRYGNALIARALLDSCSQYCLMTEEFSRKLKLEETPTFLSVQGIGSSESVSTKTIRSEVCSRSPKISGYQETMQFFVLPKLTLQLPSSSFHPPPMSIPDSSLLADPYFHESKRVDVVIGAKYYLELLKNEGRKVTKNGPTIHNSVFGNSIGRHTGRTVAIIEVYHRTFLRPSRGSCAGPIRRKHYCSCKPHTTQEPAVSHIHHSPLPVSRCVAPSAAKKASFVSEHHPGLEQLYTASPWLGRLSPTW
ncbi:uncharacterized protein LOC129738134 [Uranotaenia lowii]|uniref:uncharacterized protein LOC129738134 n=1 Tax=Uranotaenia lowii TaxID=190385 RepID=UPI002479408D|nr:uncharacterized protein LOC129738134 [Uranotaenia lowii]